MTSIERRLILDAAYGALRDSGTDFTIATILTTAGVSTRSFYRHFDSKDALLHAMYLRDGQWAAERLTKRLTDAASPQQAVVWWIDEIFSFTRSPSRAERVSVLGSITGVRAEGTDDVAARGRELLIDPLRRAIDAGCADGSFPIEDPDGGERTRRGRSAARRRAGGCRAGASTSPRRRCSACARSALSIRTRPSRVAVT